jgi:hypothetical protein
MPLPAPVITRDLSCLNLHTDVLEKKVGADSGAGALTDQSNPGGGVKPKPSCSSRRASCTMRRSP